MLILSSQEMSNRPRDPGGGPADGGIWGLDEGPHLDTDSVCRVHGDGQYAGD